MYEYKVSSNPTSQRERLVLTMLTCLIGLVAGGANLLVFSGRISIPGFSMPPVLTPWFLFSIPLTCIIWVIFRFSLPQRDLSIILVVIIAAAIWIYWLSTKSEPVFIAYMLARARGLVDIIAFDAFLLGAMATTDLIILKPWTPFLIIVAISTFPLSLFSFCSHPQAGLIVLKFMSYIAIVGCIVLETIYLLFREFRAKPVADW